jgi:hypothetical protein
MKMSHIYNKKSKMYIYILISYMSICSCIVVNVKYFSLLTHGRPFFLE